MRRFWPRDARRVVGQGPSLRIECRIPGADCNPYLAIAALLACGRAGLDQQIDAPPPFVGDMYGAESLTPLPRSLRDAVDAFGASAIEFQLVYDDRGKNFDDRAMNKSAICIGILRTFKAEGIEFAYPTQTTFTAAPDGTMVMPYAAVQPVAPVELPEGKLA